VPLSDDGSDDEVRSAEQDNPVEHLVWDVKQALDFAE